MKGRMLPVPRKAGRRNEPREIGRECGAEGEKRGAEGTEREGAAERRRGGNAACRSAVRGAFGLRTPGVSLRHSAGERGGRNAGLLKRGAEESNSSEISLIRAAEARGKAGASENGRSEDSRGAEPSRRGPCLGKNFRSGDCRRARLRLSLSCGTIFALSFMRGVFSGAPPTLVS